MSRLLGLGLGILILLAGCKKDTGPDSSIHRGSKNGEAAGDNFGSAVAIRDLMGHLRDTGEVRGGNPAFSARDRSQFLQALESKIQSIKRAYKIKQS